MLTDTEAAALVAHTLPPETYVLVAVDLPAGRYDHCSRGKGSVRNARSGATEWAEPSPDGGWRVKTGPKAARWYQKSSDGFNREETTVVDVGPQVTVNVPAGLSTERPPKPAEGPWPRAPRDRALRDAAAAAGHPLGARERPVWGRVA